MPHLNTLGARVTTLDTRTVKPQPKQTDPHYLSPQHRAWRQTVCDRAGWRCEWIDERGQRCAKAAPQHRMFADHKMERQDAPDRARPDEWMVSVRRSPLVQDGTRTREAIAEAIGVKSARSGSEARRSRRWRSRIRNVCEAGNDRAHPAQRRSGYDPRALPRIN